MPTLLQLNTSLFSSEGQSSRLADEFVEGWRTAHPDGQVITRDLAATPIPHLTAERFQSFLSQPAERTPEQQAVVDFSDALIAELRGADEEAGSVQWMTAGRGIVHSEMPQQTAGRMRGFQLWINLPAKDKDAAGVVP